MAIHFPQAPDSEDQLIATINTTPLVDVMLVLLIIFLITIPVVIQQVPVELPKERNVPTQTKPENITISVNTNGDVFWNAYPMKDKQVFFQRIVAEARKVPQPEFHIRGDKSTRWESIGKVIYNLQRGGIVKVAFISEPDAANLHITR